MSDVPYGFCRCGCGEQTNRASQTRRSLGWVKGEPIGYVLGHNRASVAPYSLDPDTGCWNWQRCKVHNGYGQLGGGLAHRAYYERAKGPVPAGLDLDHLCRNRGCVNPDHLEPVTRAENLHRGAGTKLSATDVEEIRSSGASALHLAVRFGVTRTHVYRIRRGARRPASSGEIAA